MIACDAKNKTVYLLLILTNNYGMIFVTENNFLGVEVLDVYLIFNVLRKFETVENIS